MSTSLPDDLALSVTFVPSTAHTYAVVYGCSLEQTQAIETRLRSAGRHTDHPLLIAGIFAELERQRLIAATDSLVDRFALSSSAISGGAPFDPNSARIQEYFSICLKSRNLVDQIRAVKRQLAVFSSELDLLERQWRSQLSQRKKSTATKSGLGEKDYKKEGVATSRDGDEGWINRVKSAVETGKQIKRRLADINVEYDDKIDECEMIAQNLPLAMQTVCYLPLSTSYLTTITFPQFAC